MINHIRRSILMIALLFFYYITFSQTSKEYVNMADAAYDNGDIDKAKLLYNKAAQMNNAEAHYNIAYKYSLSTNDRNYHFIEAAKLGHARSLEFVFEELFLRANSLKDADPILVDSIYESVKSVYRETKILNEEMVVQTLKRCTEAEPFDGEEFIRKNKLQDIDFTKIYSVWELAEEASRDGRFGPANQMLVLQLVCRGGMVPAELESAVDIVYNNWKENNSSEFLICEHISSGIGLTYCSEKKTAKANDEFLLRVNELTLQLKNNSGILLKPSFDIACKFIEEKAWNEEGHDGTGYIAWAGESIIQQKTKYLDLIERINTGIDQDTLVKDNDADKKLNEAYQTLINQLKKESISGTYFFIDDTKVRSVQRIWIQYRDTSSKLFAQIDPSIKQNTWKIWLTQIRTKELHQILDLSQ